MRILYFAFLFVLIATSLHAQSARTFVKQGNRAYQSGQFDEALAKYKAALEENGDPGVVAYNMGNAFYELGESEAAQEAYINSLHPSKPTVLASSLYNLGNAYFQNQKYPEAIASYIEALKRNPGDEDTKYNLELARRMLQQQQQEQCEQNQDEQNDEKQDEKESQEQQDQQQEEQQDKQNEQQQNEEDELQQQESQPQRQEQREMTPEEAERLLNALLQDEQNALEEVKKAKVAKRPKREKDW